MVDSNEQAPQTPPTTESLFGTPSNFGQPQVDDRFIRSFRDQMNVLGALWTVLGLVVEVIAIYVSNSDSQTLARSEDARMLVSILGVIGILWLVLGLLTCLKFMFAVYVGLVLNYLSLLSVLIRFEKSSIVSGSISIIAIILSHKVIRKAIQIREAGFELDGVSANWSKIDESAKN